YYKDQQEILFAKITEADIEAGNLVNPESRLQQLINRLSDEGGGVKYNWETTDMRKEWEAIQEKMKGE
ncbi:exo-alpha-sialidase, partial [bacterium]|nr:exo-alpha-sialidase [bacterium]